MIKKFKDFLKESSIGIDTKIMLLIDFVKRIDGWSYSNSRNLNWSEIKPDIIDNLKQDIKLNEEDVINLFIDHEINWDYFIKQVDQENANVDRFIYDLWLEIKDRNPNFTGTKPILGGDPYGTSWVDPLFRFDGCDETEFMYKYIYGFHITEYGQAFIASQNVDLMDFVQKGNDNFDWNQFNNYLKNYLIYYNPVSGVPNLLVVNGIKRLNFKVDINHWNNDYLTIESNIITFYYQDYIEDNGWLEYQNKDLIKYIKDILIKFIKSQFGQKSEYNDNGEILIINQVPKIWHQTKTPIQF